jgi:hypothetical protein
VLPREPHNAQAGTFHAMDRPPSDTLPPHPWAPAPLAPGVDPKAYKIANKSYDTVISTMLKQAEHRFECFLFVDDAYPTVDTQIRWSTECWEDVCVQSSNYFELSNPMRMLVSVTSPLPLQDTERLSTSRSREDARMAGAPSSNASAQVLQSCSTWIRRGPLW